MGCLLNEWGLSTKGKRIRRHTRIEKLDAESPVLYACGLAYQLIQPLLGDAAAAIRRDVDTVGITWGLAVDQHFERTGLPSAPGPNTKCKSRA